MTAKALHTAITEKQKDLTALQSDLPKIERLLQEHTDAVARAKHAGATPEELAELQVKRGGFASVLEQHKADIGALEAEIVTLQGQYAEQAGKDALTKAWATHDRLTGDYRKGTRQLLGDVLTALKGLSDVEAAIQAERRSIEKLGVTLGVYKRDPVFGDVKGPNFPRLALSKTHSLFEEVFPELATDRRVLDLLEQIAQSGALNTVGWSRHEVVQAQQEQVAAAAAKAAERQAEAQARLSESDTYRRQLAGKLS